MCHPIDRIIENCVITKCKGDTSFLIPIVILIILYLYTGVWILFGIPNSWTSLNNAYQIGNVVTLHVCLVMGLYCYYMACTTSPGYKVQKSVNGNSEEEELKEQEIIEAKKAAGKHIRYNYHLKYRYCKRCEAWKVARSHHCTMCQRCILKMDHHCPYINQCVGHNNHKSFVLFLFWVNLGMLFSSFHCIKAIFDIALSHVEYPSTKWGILLLSNVILLGLVLPNTIILFVKDIIGVAGNFTRIEIWLKHWATVDAKSRNEHYKYPYNHGIVANFYEFFGPSLILWLVPTKPITDGTSYPDMVKEQLDV